MIALCLAASGAAIAGVLVAARSFLGPEGNDAQDSPVITYRSGGGRLAALTEGGASASPGIASI
jgi:hypothetical protein